MWLLPNLFDLNLPFIQTFSPVFGYCRVDNDWRLILFRLILFISFVFFCYQLYLNPQIATKISEMTTFAFNESLSWGYNKLIARYVSIIIYLYLFQNNTAQINVYAKHRDIMDRLEIEL